MATGSPLFRSRAGSDNLVHGEWGVQPSGALPGNVGPFRLPRKETVDYVHSITQTTLLLAGLVVFLVLHRRRPKAALRKLTGRVT